MALSIGVGKHTEIAIADEILQVLDASDPFRISVIIGGRALRLTEMRQEICPEVMAFCGRNTGSTNAARIAFEAPRKIRIRRVEPGGLVGEPSDAASTRSETESLNGPNVFRIGTSQLGGEDRFTAFLHYLVDTIPAIGQSMVDLICDRSGMPRATFEHAEDHPWGDAESRPDFRLVCREFDIVCEHKLGSDLGELQLERYLRLDFSRPFNLVLITDRMHHISDSVLNSSHYRFPKEASLPYFLWENFYPAIASRSERLAQEFGALMKDLGMAPCPLPGDWADLFMRPEVAAGFYDTTADLRAYFKRMGAVCMPDASRRGVQVRRPCDWLQLLYFQVVRAVKPTALGVEPPYLISRAFIQSGELARLKPPEDASFDGRRGWIRGRKMNAPAAWDANLILAYEYVAPLHDYLAPSAAETKLRLLDFGRDVFQHLECKLHGGDVVQNSRDEI